MRAECKGLLKPELKTECKGVIMILRSAPVVEDGKIIQRTTHGCLNPDCSMFNVPIDQTDTELETF